jgi:uncharacterized protein
MSPEPAGNAHALAEIPRDECLRLLAETRFGRVAVDVGGEVPAIRPVNYAFDAPSQSVVFRTGVGSKLHHLVRSSRAAFEIDGINEPTRSGWSVIVSGVAEELTNDAEVARLEGLGIEAWAPAGKTRWVRIRAFTVTGRRIGGLPAS